VNGALVACDAVGQLRGIWSPQIGAMAGVSIPIHPPIISIS